jgi:hypothetical protein
MEVSPNPREKREPDAEDIVRNRVEIKKSCKKLNRCTIPIPCPRETWLRLLNL